MAVSEADAEMLRTGIQSLMDEYIKPLSELCVSMETLRFENLLLRRKLGLTPGEVLSS